MKFKCAFQFKSRYNLFKILTRKFSANNLANENDIRNIRNIGIFAHIDAGKTTTTERMLFFSGLITQMGEVHHGNTVTDYMEQERDRGITIKTAAVTFFWKKFQFNLLDTPGHIDFTMEVEQTFNALDGAILVLDGSAGVEAQTLTVWRQIQRFNLPVIIYTNKMDRPDANLDLCRLSIEQKLGCNTLCLQIPLKDKNKFSGIIDIITRDKLVWTTSGHKMHMSRETIKQNDPLWAECNQARHNIIDTLSNFDNKIANKLIESENFDDITADEICIALRSATINLQVVPIFCGSSYKNIGVQPLMDAIILCLPHPKDRKSKYQIFQDSLAASIFKIIHDKQKGLLTFLRIHSGKLTKGQKVFNVHKDVAEQIGKLYIASADNYEEIDQLHDGKIAAVSGLKQSMIGDLITSSASATERIRNLLKENRKISNDKKQISDVLDIETRIPEPVFFCSIEPPSTYYEPLLEQALNELKREDPSLRVFHDISTGQTVLAGMGELHLEIIKDRIHKEYKIQADLGPLQIAYKECPQNNATVEITHSDKIGNSKQTVTIDMSLRCMTENVPKPFCLDKTSEAASALANVHIRFINAVSQGVTVGLRLGPKIGCEVIQCQIMLHNLITTRSTSESFVTAAATKCVQKMLEDSNTTIMEPLMALEIITLDDYFSAILADLSKRRTAIHNIMPKGNSKVVTCEAPLAEMMGYSTVLRTISSGTATFSMEFVAYRNMTIDEEIKAIEKIRGF